MWAEGMGLKYTNLSGILTWQSNCYGGTAKSQLTWVWNLPLLQVGYSMAWKLMVTLQFLVSHNGGGYVSWWLILFFCSVGRGQGLKESRDWTTFSRSGPSRVRFGHFGGRVQRVALPLAVLSKPILWPNTMLHIQGVSVQQLSWA